MTSVGLTGILGSGKSTALALFAKHGIPTLEADDVAREVLQPGHAAFHKAVKVFGRGIVRQDGTLDRAKVAAIVFANGRKLRELNSIVHPYVTQAIKRFLRECKARHERLCVVGVPLLYEAGLEKLFDVVVVVRATRQVILRRAAKSRRMGRQEILRRLQFQMPLAEKCRRADVILDNNGSLRNLSKQVKKMLCESYNRRK